MAKSDMLKERKLLHFLISYDHFVIPLQQIYNQEMGSLSNSAKILLTFVSTQQSMMKARKKAIPSSPDTFEEAIAGFEANQFPELYQVMNLGHAKHQFEGEINVLV